MPAYPNAEKYDVIQVDWGNGKGWQDFTTLKEPGDFWVAKRMVETSQPPPGFPPKKPGEPIPRFRITSFNAIKYP
jgi:hypothetical protein